MERRTHERVTEAAEMGRLGFPSSLIEQYQAYQQRKELERAERSEMDAQKKKWVHLVEEKLQLLESPEERCVMSLLCHDISIAEIAYALGKSKKGVIRIAMSAGENFRQLLQPTIH